MQSDVASLRLLFFEFSVESFGAGSLSVETTPLMPNERIEISMNLCEQHFRKTESLVRALAFEDVATWLINEGYFPEQNILPPSLHVEGAKLQSQVHFQRLDNLPRCTLASISYPKSSLSNRYFSVQDPIFYHDLVFHNGKNWKNILDHIFRTGIRIFSYSMPIPVNSRNERDVRIKITFSI